MSIVVRAVAPVTDPEASRSSIAGALAAERPLTSRGLPMAYGLAVRRWGRLRAFPNPGPQVGTGVLHVGCVDDPRPIYADVGTGALLRSRHRATRHERIQASKATRPGGVGCRSLR